MRCDCQDGSFRRVPTPSARAEARLGRDHCDGPNTVPARSSADPPLPSKLVAASGPAAGE